MNVGQRVQERLDREKLKRAEDNKVAADELVKWILSLSDDYIYNHISSGEYLNIGTGATQIFIDKRDYINNILLDHNLSIRHVLSRNQVFVHLIIIPKDEAKEIDKAIEECKSKSFWRFWK